MVDDFERMWADLAPVGRSERSGGYFRQPFTSAERELDVWFREQVAARGLELVEDATGNLVAWWRPFGATGDGVLTGSHLDSVRDGGAHDGPLGVVSALSALDALRERGLEPARPLGIGVFVEEEGSRFGLACLGSRLTTGAISWEQARELRDPDGIALGDVVAGGGPGLLAEVGTYLELHVEQGRDLVHRDAAVGAASGIWPHGRYRFDVHGQANHAGTTRMEDRADPMTTCAATVLAASDHARRTGARATFGRLEITPGSTNAVPSLVRAWLDARAESEDQLSELTAKIEAAAESRAIEDGTTVEVTAESVSPAVVFDAELTRTVAGDRPVVPTAAGHDAGILSAAGIPTAMLFVRNPTGVSHSPAESATTADCLAGVDALTDALERLLR